MHKKIKEAWNAYIRIMKMTWGSAMEHLGKRFAKHLQSNHVPKYHLKPKICQKCICGCIISGPPSAQRKVHNYCDKKILAISCCVHNLHTVAC